MSPVEDPTPSSSEPASALLDRWLSHRGADRLRRPAPEPPAEEPTQPPRVTLVSSDLAASAAAPPPPPPTPAAEIAAEGSNGSVTFKPKRGARRVVGVLLLASLAATALAGHAANEARTTNTIAVAVTLGALTLVLWALRAGSSAPRLSVSNGQLEVLGSSGRFVFDLTSAYTQIEVIGTPGRRGWKVLFLRRGMSPYVVDSSMVDAARFMSVLRHHRPERSG